MFSHPGYGPSSRSFISVLPHTWKMARSPVYIAPYMTLANQIQHLPS
jgi:hypothetical protein